MDKKNQSIPTIEPDFTHEEAQNAVTFLAQNTVYSALYTTYTTRMERFTIPM